MSINKLFLVIGILFFIVFALDIQHDRDFMTWIWLLSSQLSFLACLIFWIRPDSIKIKNNE